ncbi:ribonuclease P protein component [Flavobacteriaceae bacterium]|jgi:ribonuclease P protein component|nr:ribonuclease P protein component [Flavobacteriaceae bacterium]MDB2418186.1 ribonuclease P protein component [Flavobacteriaceae bacterium]MDB2624808.1 ribonuclease P protein component [Flavobacteriaceae bacterium]MDB2674689.1 ribonuclease P protein component [Flavobacteriaceae bacterium]MDG1980489.1 ribonuclease P protein component [Flavobacteriaceae bacterium]|tara:strand:- start:115 stop:492 length:378 start_codon:yes stop_codon:yes gene_type:complete
MNNSLGKKERLKSQKLIGRLFEEGASLKIFPFRLIYITTEKSQLQSSFSVPKRNFKKAVDRNRIKRLIKEAYRLEKKNAFKTSNYNCVFMITYLGKKEPSFLEVQKKIRELLKLFIETQARNENE